MKRRTDNGFEEWVSALIQNAEFPLPEQRQIVRGIQGGYMSAKISKLEAQFEDEKNSVKRTSQTSNLFKDVSIFVNGYTEPSADELRCLMLAHGGTYHHYYRSEKTTHVIASALPFAKFDHMKTLKVVKPEWITESIKANKILNCNNYLLKNDFPQRKYDKVISNLRGDSIAEKGMLKIDLKVSKTAADEGYLKEFYSNSRLHYISTLGCMLKQFVMEKRERHDGSFPRRKHLLGNSELDTELNFEGKCIVMHIDMDCFFVSVALRNHPHLRGHPVAVTHARSNVGSHRNNVNRLFEASYYKDKVKSKVKSLHRGKCERSDDDGEVEHWSNEVSSMSEIASCSYEARKFGISKGMYLGAALKLCPNLKTVPYDFEGYKEVSLMLYNTISGYTLDIEAVSCDELFIDCTTLLSELRMDPCKVAEILRLEIEEKTKCTASIGIGANKLQARLATKHAKPNGKYYLSPDVVNSFLEKLSVCEIPGVGRTTGEQLRHLSVKTCADLQKVPLETLKKEFGAKSGELLYNSCRGIDNRPVNFNHERKSVSAEVNYGIRFNDHQEAETFLGQLSEEVSNRLKDAKLAGKNVTLKLMFRAKDAPAETAKYLGHGACETLSRSGNLGFATNDATIIGKQVLNLYRQLSILPNDLRGVGIQVTKLERGKRTLKTLRTYFGESRSDSNLEASSEPPVGKDAETVEPTNTNIIILPRSDVDFSESSHEEDDKEEYGIARGTCEYSELNMLLKLNLEEMKSVVKEWVKEERVPQLYDAILIKSYLTCLIEGRRLEKLCILVRCLHRYIRIQRNGNELWEKTYDDIVDTLQGSMMATFGRKLADEKLSFQ